MPISLLADPLNQSIILGIQHAPLLCLNIHEYVGLETQSQHVTAKSGRIGQFTLRGSTDPSESMDSNRYATTLQIPEQGE